MKHGLIEEERYIKSCKKMTVEGNVFKHNAESLLCSQGSMLSISMIMDGLFFQGCEHVHSLPWVAAVAAVHRCDRLQVNESYKVVCVASAGNC